MHRLTILVFVWAVSVVSAHDSLGSMFTHKADVGDCAFKGETVYDITADAYMVTGSGANIWTNVDAFHFAYKKVTGDVIFEADVNFMGNRKTHKKACLMLRADLSADSAYADAVFHGDGRIDLQYRPTKGAMTQFIMFPEKKWAAMRLSRNGTVFSLEITDDEGETYQPVGAVTVELPGEVYAGLAVSSHNNGFTRTAIFSKVKLEEIGTLSEEETTTESTLEIYDVETRQRHIVYRTIGLYEAPNWTPDGKTLVVNKDGLGKMYAIPVDAPNPMPKQIDTGSAILCNNDHLISADGKTLFISDHHEGKASLIYTVPLSGGEPIRITDKGPSYLHGVSPDGKHVLYVARRKENGDDNFHIYTKAIAGGLEIKLTDGKGIRDDGSEYSPDGKTIYYNSTQSGLMKIWRMNVDGSDPMQITHDEEYNDWFAHPSPDNKKIVFLSYDKSVLPHQHPRNKEVCLRMMDIEGGKP
ncbi:hypothetical protein ACFL6U_05490 [Planctomycetota bacterium]